MITRALPAVAALVASCVLAACGADRDDTATAGQGAASTAQPATVWAVGDGADGRDKSQALARRISAGPIDRLLYLGDVYEEGTAEEFDRNYTPVYGELAAKTEPTPGNHEWDNHEEGYDAYWAESRGEAPASFRAFELGGWEIVALNSEAEGDLAAEQVDWLSEQVSRPGSCRLAFWHRPLFSAGTHEEAPEVQPLWDVLVGHAALVVNAHDHNIQRMKPRDGLTELIAGAGGHGHYEVDEEDDRLAFSNDETYAALRLELRPGRADFAFVTADGRTLDSGSVPCQPLS